MSKTALSVYLYGLYLILSAGIPFLVIPDAALGVLGLSAPDDIWVRLFGVAIAIIGGFYVLSVHYDLDALFVWTVPARYATAAVAIVMVVLGKVGTGYLLAPAIDIVSASLTWLAIRAEASGAAADEAPG